MTQNAESTEKENDKMERRPDLAEELKRLNDILDGGGTHGLASLVHAIDASHIGSLIQALAEHTDIMKKMYNGMAEYADVMRESNRVECDHTDALRRAEYAMKEHTEMLRQACSRY